MKQFFENENYLSEAITLSIHTELLEKKVVRNDGKVLKIDVSIEGKNCPRQA